VFFLPNILYGLGSKYFLISACKHSQSTGKFFLNMRNNASHPHETCKITVIISNLVMRWQRK